MGGRVHGGGASLVYTLQGAPTTPLTRNADPHACRCQRETLMLNAMLIANVWRICSACRPRHPANRQKVQHLVLKLKHSTFEEMF